jgi:predicted pyridoxine 5'-phosphate oxidase superfamily flavin-nucleotide-binding protein
MRKEAREDRLVRAIQPQASLSSQATPTLEPFVHQKYVLLTTYRRDGTPVGTPVNIAVEGDRAFVRTWDTAWKVKRIRNNSEVEVAPSTLRGKPTGPAILHGLLVPLVHRLRRNKTVHIELKPVDS